jgi:hypothetical protein
VGDLGGVVGDATVAEAGQGVVGDEVPHLLVEVDAGQGPRGQRRDDLGGGDVVDLEQRLPDAPRREDLTPHVAVDDDGRAEPGDATGRSQHGALDRVAPVGPRLVRGASDPAAVLADEGAQGRPVLGADRLPGERGPAAALDVLDQRRVDGQGAARVLLDAGHRDRLGAQELVRERRGRVDHLADLLAAVEPVRCQREPPNTGRGRGRRPPPSGPLAGALHAVIMLHCGGHAQPSSPDQRGTSLGRARKWGQTCSRT